MKPRSLAFLLALVLALVLTPTTLAQSGKTVTVRQRNATITLQSNGDAQFVETWVVDFQNGPFTFAFREIPKNKLRDVIDFQVSEGDQPLRVETDKTDSAYKFTWYFPATNQGAKFFSDVHTFTLRYTVRGAARIYPQGDQFWWKFIEANRAYTIDSSQVVLHLPAKFGADQLKATTYLGTTEVAGAQIINGSTIEYNGGPFPPQSTWEIRAQFPHVITAPPEAWQQIDDQIERTAAQNNFYAVVATVLLGIGGPLLLLVLWYLVGRDKPTTFAAEFLSKPPDDTPPGVVGTLLDEHADLQDILATIADLAQRGFLRIRESDAFGTPAYERTNLSDDHLAPFEKETLDALLRGNPFRRLDDVRGSFYSYLPDLQRMLYDQVVARGFFPSSPFATRARYYNIGKWGALLVPILGAPAYCFTFVLAPLAFLPLLILELFFIGLVLLSRVMPQRTPKGALAAAQWNAFKRYLANIEKYTQVNEAKNQFASYLSYAIAFGLEKRWIENFQKVATPAPTWYIPYNASNDWSWRDVNPVHPAHEDDTRKTGTTDLGTLGVNPNTPAPHDARPSSPRLPSLNELANNSFLALNSVSSNMFQFLNTSADAFTAKPPSRSTADAVLDSVGSFLSWLGSSSSRSSSSDSSSSYSSSSDSSSSSSSSSWSGGSSSSGGGGGGGSSGFG